MIFAATKDGTGRSAPDIYTKFMVAVAAACLWLEVAYLVSADHISLLKPAFDVFGFPIGRDFINNWMAGRSAFLGGPASWFDAATYNAALREVTGHPDFPAFYWSYPPHLVLIAWPLGLLPYLPAYLLWCAAGLALYVMAARCAGAERSDTWFLLLSPAVAVNVFFGQNGFLTAALLIGVLANLDRRPLWAGILCGLLTIKPQFGFLLPILLLMTGRWRVIAAAVAATALVVLVTAVWFGPAVWVSYVTEVMPQQRGLILDAGGLNWPMVASAFVNAYRLGLSVDVAWAVQAVTSCCAVAMVVWTFWRRRDPELSLALFVTATFLFSPWMLNYDMVVFGWVVTLLRKRPDNTVADHALALAVWTLPLAMMALGAWRIPTAMLVLPAFAGRLIWRLANSHARQAEVGVAYAGPGSGLATPR